MNKPVVQVVETTELIELNQTATVQVNPFKGVEYLSIRYMYEDQDGELRFGKNGVNIPIEWAPKAIKKLIETYNKATGSTFELTGTNTLPDPEA